MTDRDASQLYKHLLDRLREVGGTELIREIEVTVGRGKLRTGEEIKPGGFQTTLSAHEALVVALRMLVAAVEPPIYKAEAEKASESTIAWRFDELEYSRRGAGAVPSPEALATTTGVPELPSLTKDELDSLGYNAARLLALAQATERELDVANAQ